MHALHYTRNNIDKTLPVGLGLLAAKLKPVAGLIIGSKQTERKLVTTLSHLIGYMQCKMQGYILL